MPKSESALEKELINKEKKFSSSGLYPSGGQRSKNERKRKNVEILGSCERIKKTTTTKTSRQGT